MAAFSAWQYSQAQKDKKEQDAAAKKALASRPTLGTPDTLTEQIDTARAQMNSVDPSLIATQQQLQQQQANQMAFAQRNASSGAQALAAGAEATAQTQAIMPALMREQRGYNMQNLANLNNALAAGTENARMRHDDQLGRYGDQVNYSMGRMAAAQQNKSQAIALGAQSLMGVMQGMGPNTGFGMPTAAAGTPGSTGMRIAEPMPALQPAGTQMAASGIYPAMQQVPMVNGQYSPLVAYYMRQNQFNPYRF